MTKSEKLKVKIKSSKKLTGVGFLKLEVGDVAYVTVNSAITRTTIKKKPASVVSVTNLENGEICKFLLSRVVENILLETYGEDGFINKSFRIEKGEKQKGGENDYYGYEVEEIEV